MALQLSFHVEDKTTTICLKGSLNENASALDGVVLNAGFNLHLDLRDLVSINSLGIRHFKIWINNIKCQKIRLFYCPRAFINQLNLVVNFLPDETEIESFFVPYFSETLAEEKMVLFTKELEFKKANGIVTYNLPRVLDSQGHIMEIDCYKEMYFRFLEKYY
jgi:hypothetical protein